jgi:two-component system OmpR family response regulator
LRVLVVEDEALIADRLRQALAEAGWAVDLATDGEQAHFQGETEPYDAIVLDLGLPRLDGLSVLKRWRAAGIATPVLVLTARGSWHEKVEGIDAGADDYLAKPFHMAELLARLRALRRRAAGHAAPVLRCGTIELDTRAARVSVGGQPVGLTALEFRILDYLMHHAGKLVSRTELTEHVYAQDFDRDSNTLEVLVGRLRRKLGTDSIETVRGLGYRLVGGR